MVRWYDMGGGGVGLKCDDMIVWKKEKTKKEKWIGIGGLKLGMLWRGRGVIYIIYVSRGTLYKMKNFSNFSM